MHQHLVDLSHLACSSYDELVKHRSGYEQAYVLECRKLQQNVAEYNALALDHKRLEQENSYYQQQLLPHYHHLFYRQEQETQEARKQAGSSEARSRELEKKSIEQAEEHKRTTDAAIELLRTQGEKVEELESRIEELSTLNQAPSARLQSPNTRKRQRSSKPGGESSVQAGEPARRSQRCKQSKLV
jgi:hypothetical protein